MSRPRAGLVAVLLASGLLPHPAASAAPEGSPPAAARDRPAMLSRFYRASGLEKQARSEVRERVLKILGGDAKKTDAMLGKIDWSAVDRVVLAEIDRAVDAAALAESVALLEGPEGDCVRRLLALDRGLSPLRGILGEKGLGYREAEAFEIRVGDAFQGAVEAALAAAAPEQAAETNERFALQRLRNLATCQAQIGFSGRIDCDEDGIGEYGTIMELTGACGLRAGFTAGEISTSDFSTRKDPLPAPILSPTMASVDGNGIVRSKGYCFRVFLPAADGVKAGFVHEVGPAKEIGLDGDSFGINVELSETTWCAYAWPEKWGVTGKKAFFVGVDGDVTSSPNTVNRWSGTEKAPPGDSALLGPGIESKAADGKKGRDGEVWSLAE